MRCGSTRRIKFLAYWNTAATALISTLAPGTPSAATRFAVITGSTGRERIYDGYPDVALEMVDSRTFDGRLQLLEYVPTILDGPPGNR